MNGQGGATMKIAIYSRKSVYTGKGESIENQIELCRQYLTRHQYEWEESDLLIYEDEGFSGKNGKRPQFQKMLQDMRAKKFDCLVCYRLDRISRNVSDFSTLIEELNQRQISFLCIKEQFDTSNPMGKAMMYMASVFAQLERETIAERVRDNMMMLARTGRWLGGTTPLGFSTEHRREILMDGKRKLSCQLRECPQELDIVSTIFEQFYQKKSISAVRSYLEQHHIRNRSGKPYSLPGLKEILSNPVYCQADSDARRYFLSQGSDVCFREEECSSQSGLLAYNKRNYTKKHAPRQPKDQWIIAVGNHPGLLTGQRWIQAQSLLEQGSAAAARISSRQTNALFSGKIICTQCGKAMFAKSRSRQPEKFDYICSTKLRNGVSCCSCPNLSGPETDRLILQHLPPISPKKSELSVVLGRLKRNYEKETKQRFHPSVVQKIQNNQREIQRFLDILAHSEPSPRLIQQINLRLEELTQDTEQLQKEHNTSSCFISENTKSIAESCLSFFVFPIHYSELFDRKECIPFWSFIVPNIHWDGNFLQIFTFS